MKDLDLHLTLPSGPMTLRFGPGHDELAQEMAQLWAHMAGSEPGAVRVISAPDHPDPTARGMMIPPGPGAAYTLSGYITREVLRGLVGKRLLLHAGVIEHPQLGVVLLVGPSGAGKSRATTVLGREGRYLTDELAIIDPSRFTVQAYPKPVSRVQENGRKRDLTLSSQGLEPALVAGAPDHVVLLNRVDARDDGPSTSASLRRVPLAEALVAIVGQSSSMWQIPEALVMLARLLDRAGGALEVTYVDAEQIAPLLSDPPTPVAEYWTAVEGATAPTLSTPDRHGPDPSSSSGAGTEAELYRCAPFTSAVQTEENVIILAERSIRVLSGIGAVVWTMLRESSPRTLTEIEAELVTMLGEHPDSAELVARTLRELVTSGALRSP